MFAAANPGHPRVAAVLGGAVAVAVAARAIGLARIDRPGGAPEDHGKPRARWWSRLRWDFLRLGGFWLAVPIAIGAAIGTHTLVEATNLAMVAAVFAIAVIAARRRGRDLSVGYAVGLLIALAALVASAYGNAAGDGAVFSYPADLTGLLGLACAGRIGLDRTFARWQRVAAVSVGAATLVAVSSPVAFTAAAVGGLAYAVWRVRGVWMPRPLREHPVAAAARAGGPLLAVSALWLVSLASVSGARVDVPGAASFGRSGVLGTIFGVEASGTFGTLSGAGVVGLAALVAGSGLLVWRVTGPGLPVWVPVVGLAGLVGVLGGGFGPLGPSPAWAMAFAAELWVSGHGLRPDRDVTPAPALIDDSD